MIDKTRSTFTDSSSASAYRIRSRQLESGAILAPQMQSIRQRHGVSEDLRLIGTIRRECLDHMIVFNERCLRRHLQSFIDYYHRSRTHLGLEKDTPELRPIQPPTTGRIISIPEVGGLHHRYERRAA